MCIRDSFITQQHQENLLQRQLNKANELYGCDHQLAKAIVKVRLTHDQYAISSIQNAAEVTIQAHLAGMAATPSAQTEADVRAAMEAVITRHNLTCAYNSIVTVQGDVLHNQSYHRPIKNGALLLADVGAEAKNLSLIHI